MIRLRIGWLLATIPVTTAILAEPTAIALGSYVQLQTIVVELAYIV